MGDASNLVTQSAGDRRKLGESALAGPSGTRVAALLHTCPSQAKWIYAVRAEKVANGSQAEAIRLKCLECCCFNAAEVEKCPIEGCALHDFRSAHAKRRRRGQVAVQESHDSTGDPTEG